ncbi:MAG: tRNA lysidine(34) synthetase TilS [Candidimonas sp.]
MEINVSIIPEKFVFALSGGSDSIALLDWLVRHHYEPIVVHVNHQINPKSSQWAEFCRTICHNYGLNFYVHDVIVDGKNIENSAREKRYGVLTSYGLPIITAHHAEDQIETFFLRLFRGAGPKGLIGMSEITKINGIEVIRPMLGVKKSTIEQYVIDNELDFIVDDSNFDDRYDRNWIRIRLIPMMRGKFSRFDGSIEHVRTTMRDVDDCLTDLAKMDFDKAVIDKTHIDTIGDARLRNLLHWTFFINGITLSRKMSDEMIRRIRQNKSVRSVHKNFHPEWWH